jgi:hypothetical protein
MIYIDDNNKLSAYIKEKFKFKFKFNIDKNK